MDLFKNVFQIYLRAFFNDYLRTYYICKFNVPYPQTANNPLHRLRQIIPYLFSIGDIPVPQFTLVPN